jgi:integrase
MNKSRSHKLDPRKVRIGGKTFWQIDMGSEVRDGRRTRLRRTFADRVEAETFAKLKKTERENHGTAGISLPERLRGEAIEADRLLAPFPGVSVLDAVREYVRRRELVTKSETVANALKGFMEAKTSDNMRPRYLEDLRSRLGRFAETFGDRKLADIQSGEIDNWLRALGQAPVSRNTCHLRLHTFFEFARQRGWVEANPLKDVPRAKVSPSGIGILSIQQSARILESASEETLPYHAIGLFCGLRSAELERLEWSDIHFDENLVEVPSLKSKTASRRFVTIRPNLALWLEPYRGRRGPICPPALYERLCEDRQRAGILQWPANAARHSFASYHLAAFRDVKDLALEMGHTRSEVTFRHYRELVRPSEGERFWKIVPAVSSESIAVVA